MEVCGSGTSCGTNIKDYELNEKLGEGAFAKVYKAKCLIHGGHPVAIKRIERSLIERRKLQARVEQEISIHKQLKHPNIVQCYTTFEDKDSIYLVLELCKSNLDEHIKNENSKGLLPEFIAYYFIKQVAEGVAYLHDNLILHRDLSLRNILLATDNKIKISDFGFATKLSNKKDFKCSVLGTPNFQSPEIHNRESYGFKTDCWSLGCVVFAILDGKLPFDSKTVKDVIKAALTKDIQDIIPKGFSPEAKKLLIGLLHKIPSKRISIAEVLKSSFFIKFDCDSYQGITRNNISEFTPLRTKNGDSGMGSTSNSSSATRKYSHRSNKTDSGLGFSNSDFNESTKYHGNYKTTHLGTIHSSGDSYQNSSSKSRQRGLNPSLGIHEENNLSQKSKESSENYRSLGLLKRQIPALPSRHETMDPIRSFKRATSPIIAAYSDKREHSVSEEWRKEHYQRMQSPQKKSNSYDVECASHQNKDGLKKSRKKSKERRSQHSSPHKDTNHSSDYSHHSRSNIPTDKCNSTHKDESGRLFCRDGISCRFNHSLFDDKCDNQSSPFLLASSEKQIYQEKYSLHHSSNNEVNDQNRKNLHPKKIQQETSTLEKKPLPLNAERLRPCRYPMKKIAVVSILENEEVCVEWLKTKKENQYVSDVLRISDHGEQIYAYKPTNCLVGDTPPPKPEKYIKQFNYNNLDKAYWKMYRKAKVLVDFVRATTPKIIYYDKNYDKCVMMENDPDPDFEVEFFDGGSITQKSNKVTFTDECGKSILFTEIEYLDKHFAAMWGKFCFMKEECKETEARLEARHFPIMVGNPPLKKRSCSKDNFKENIPQHSSGPSTISKNNYKCKSYEETKINISNSSSKYLHNAQQHMSLPSPKPVSNIEAIFMKLKSKPKLIKEEVCIEYKDGCVVYCSKDEKEVKIYDYRNNCIYDSWNKSRNGSDSALINMILQDLPYMVTVAVLQEI